MRGGMLWRTVVQAVGAAPSAVAGAANIAYCTLARTRPVDCSCEAHNYHHHHHHHHQSYSCDCCTNSSSADASFVVLQPINLPNSEPESTSSWPRSPQLEASEIKASLAAEDWIEPPPYKMATSPTDPLSPALMEAFSCLQQNSQGQVCKK